jgi:hypothetical protein
MRVPPSMILSAFALSFGGSVLAWGLESHPRILAAALTSVSVPHPATTHGNAAPQQQNADPGILLRRPLFTQGRRPYVP